MKATDMKEKYRAEPAIALTDRTWPSTPLTHSPDWCSVDLRDGNQALPNPMDPDQKLEYFQLLVRLGFRQIEIGFPSASQDDFDFMRRLIEENRIPDDVFIMGLTQCRAPLIDRTFEAMRGLSRGILHAYIATSELHMRSVFNLDAAGTLARAIEATQRIRARAEAAPGADIRFEFSPEEFTDTDPGFAVEICAAVFETWGQATAERPMILNLPATVERRPPNEYADLIELFIRTFPYRDRVRISLHGHNDQGMAVAATELALRAGADRVEGTLFGHGERTGNVDLVTVACNLEARGISTGLDFSDLAGVSQTVERLTGLPVYYRQPYAGEYVFTAFSGSHQDAINKGMHESAGDPARAWKVPYLHVDPADLGRSFERLIRINSQSGKGGIAWVLEKEYGLEIPRGMQPELRDAVQTVADRLGRELSSEEVREIFDHEFLRPKGRFELIGYWPRPDDRDPTHIRGEARVRVDGQQRTLQGEGNGPVSAFVKCVTPLLDCAFSVDDYHEQAIGKGADAQAVAYVPLRMGDGTVLFGVGTDSNIDQAAVRAIMAGMNRLDARVRER